MKRSEDEDSLLLKESDFKNVFETKKVHVLFFEVRIFRKPLQTMAILNRLCYYCHVVKRKGRVKQ